MTHTSGRCSIERRAAAVRREDVATSECARLELVRAPQRHPLTGLGIMQLREIIAVALSSLRANKLRSGLTMLGIIIGIAAVITVVGLGLGAQRAVHDRLAQLGTTLLRVQPERQRRGSVQLEEPKRLTIADAIALTERGQHFAAVQPQQDRQMQVVHRNRNTSSRVVSTTSNFLRVRGFRLAAGRMFTPAEDAAMRRVAVLGASVVRDLGYFSAATLVGERIRIGGRLFQVAGVLAPSGRAATWRDPDNQVLVPLRTGQARLFGTNWLNDIYVLASSEAAVPLAMADIQTILRREHRLAAGAPNDFRIRNQSDFLVAASDTTEMFTYLIAGLAAISLVVGGIGIMNIMLVSVTERTREVGIRKALGATKRVILMQFLAEAVFTSMVGGVAGVLAGITTILVVRDTFGLNAALAPGAMVGAVVFAGLIGIVFGVWPAQRAATLDPIDALRYE
jgi:putative ABC transport system permease protein